MLLYQEAGDWSGGDAGGADTLRCLGAHLLGVQRLLVAYDTDTAGVEGAVMWEAVTSGRNDCCPWPTRT